MRRDGEVEVAGWFQRRVVRADLRAHDIVSSSGASVYRFGEYLEDSRFGRWFWLVASVTQLLVFLGVPFALAWGIWERSDLDRGDPARIGIVALVAVPFWFAALVWQGSVRGMARNLSAPRREWDPDQDDE